MEITTTNTIDTNALWEAIWGDDGGGITYWCDKIRTTEGKSIRLWTSDYKPNPQDFKLHCDQTDEWHTVSLHELATAYQTALNQGLKHCGTYSINLDDPDACFGDTIIQLAVFGELVFG